MTEMETGMMKDVAPDLRQNLSRVDESLDIMDRHAGSMREAESTIQDDMRRWDREFKDSHLHSIPRARKHQR